MGYVRDSYRDLEASWIASCRAHGLCLEQTDALFWERAWKKAGTFNIHVCKDWKGRHKPSAVR